MNKADLIRKLELLRKMGKSPFVKALFKKYHDKYKRLGK